MFVDEKTLVQLYADTEKVLFTLENKPEAVRKMMEIISDTPEYLQMMNSVPLHAQDAPKADWWKSQEVECIIDELLQVLKLYAPDEFMFCSYPGTEDHFGYWKIYKNIDF